MKKTRYTGEALKTFERIHTGRSYLVEIYNINTTESSYKIFHTQEGAIKAYTTVVTWLLQSMYSDEQRRKMLLEMHD